jgi:ubiquinone/menaquinone biosynthesis C-methylase UbiE
MSGQPANAQQIEYWNATAGPKWVELQRQLDEQLEPYGAAVATAAAVAPGESVLDVGCGCGGTSLDLGRRVGPRGAVLGIDISDIMLARARETTARAGVANVKFERADAQVHAFARDSFDVVYSRFGVMFFDDSVAAFRNLRTGLKRGGRLGFICWQSAADNPWMSLPTLAVMQHVPVEVPADPHAPGPFAFADSARVKSILESAGFREVRHEELRRDVTVGGAGDLESALAFILRMCPASKALAEADAKTRAAATDAVRASMTPFQRQDGGVAMPSAAWIVTARSA